MSNLWTAVKQIRTEKRFRNAPAPLDALAARVRQLTSDLTMLRRALKHDKALVTCINSIISHNAKLTADVDKVARWCERLVGPVIVYIECYTQGQDKRPESVASLLKAPFTFLPEIKELLVDLERFTSKDCGVSAISALLTVSRRLLTLHTSSGASNDFEFSSVRSFTSGWGVSAAFNPVDIVERALFDMSVDGAPDIISEILLLKTHGVKSLAICGVRQSGSRFLMYPPFKGQEFELKPESQSLTLEQGDRSITLSAAPYILSHWQPIISELFSADPSAEESSAGEANALGIAFGNAYDERNANEKFGNEFEDFDESFEKTTVTPSQSLNALKRISVGMPMDFSDDLAKILRSIEEEDNNGGSSAGTPVVAAPTPPVVVAPVVVAPEEPAVTTLAPHKTAPIAIPSVTESVTASPDILAAPSAPFARGGSRRASGATSNTGSPASFFTVGSEFPSVAQDSVVGTPASSLDSPRTLDEAHELRRRISMRISARENEDIKERFQGTPLSTHTQESVTSLTSMIFSDSSSVNRSATCLAKTDSLRDTSKSVEPIRSQPPTIPAPAPEFTDKAERATVVRVCMPKRINFSADEKEPEAIANDLSTVPASPLMPPQAPAAVDKSELGLTKFAGSNPELVSQRRSPALRAPRLVMSMYSPKLGTPELPRSLSDENRALSKQSQSSLVSVPSAQPNIWFTEDPSKSSKVKAISKFFKKKPKTPKHASSSPMVKLTNNSSTTVATQETLKETAKEFSDAPPAASYVSAATNAAPSPMPAAPAPSRPEPPKEGSVTSIVETETAVPLPEPRVPAPTASALTDRTSSSTIVKSKSYNSVKSYSSSDTDLSSKLNNRASTIFYQAKPASRDLFDLPSTTKDADPTAVCVDSHNTTIASGNSFKVNSIPSSLNTSQSYASSLQSRGTISTANTSVGSTKAWAEFMTGVNSNVSRQAELREEQEELARQAQLDRKSEELKKLEEEVEQKKRAIKEASQRVSDLDSSTTLDPGNQGKINRGVPLLRELYDKKEQETETAFQQEAPKSEVSQLSIYRHPTQVASAPIIKMEGVSPLMIKKPANSVTFSEPTTPTSPANISFSGQMWVSKWTVNRWVPLSQAELQVEIKVTAENDLIVITMPGSSRPIKLKYTSSSDARSSNAHDVEVRVKEDVYMFRCRSTHRCKKFHQAIIALTVDPQDPQTFIRKAQEADSTSGSSGSSTSSARLSGVPPKLAQTVNSRLRSVFPIIEE